jgi:D-serine deaminase-like pyridoxal phosphate-dependent protein
MNGLSIQDICEPTLLLDETKCKNNINRVVSKVKNLGIQFRPHFKTHQSKEIGRWFQEFGVEKIAVSSLKMAKYFAQAGWKDILIAFPLNLRELPETLLLTKHINLKLTISDISTIEFLSNILTFPIDVYLEIDVGYGRSGLPIDNFNLIAKALSLIKKTKFINLIGILSHNGNVYFCNSKDEVIEQNRIFLGKLFDLKNKLTSEGFDLILSVGDTPSVSICDDFYGVDELRPGNFVFYDVQQAYIGSCDFEDIAVCLAAPIVAIYPERNEMICYGGAVHLSKDYIEIDGVKFFGLLVDIFNDSWSFPLENSFVRFITQEHSVIRTTPQVLSRYKVGDLIGILPIHSCLTADAMKKYLVPNKSWFAHL